MGIYIPDTFSSVGDAVVTGGTSFLLDAHPGAVVAYSLWQLSAAYTGPCIQVRRASDNTTLDIGFDTSTLFLDTTALTAFCTGTNGFVAIWYDQSGRGQNLLAASSPSNNQPIIYNSSTGIVISATNGLPCLGQFGETTSPVPKFMSTALSGVGMPTTDKVTLLGVNRRIQSTGSNQQNVPGFLIADYSVSPTVNRVFFRADSLNPYGVSSIFVNFGTSTSISLKSSSVIDGIQTIQIDCVTGTGVAKKNNTTPIPFTYAFTVNSIGTSNFLIEVAGSNGTSFSENQEYVVWNNNTVDTDSIIANANSRWKVFIPYIYQLDEFDTSGTWTKPANSIMHEVVVIGAGGGASSGSKQASGTASVGGAGGGFGSVSWIHLLSSSLGATEAVTIGAGGLGGASLTDGNNNTNGQAGSSGGATSFGTHVGLQGGGGSGGVSSAGTVVNWATAQSTPNTNRYVFSRDSTFGGHNGNPSGGAGTSGDSQSVARNFSLPRTPSGGGITAGGTPTAGAGGAGTRILNNMTGQALNVAAIGGSVNNGFPGNGGISNYGVYVGSGPIMWQTGNVGTMQYGCSGGGGGGSTVGNAGRGGDPGLYGSGGAGGGASHNGPGRNSGRGGHGAQGCVKILSIIIPS